MSISKVFEDNSEAVKLTAIAIVAIAALIYFNNLSNEHGCNGLSLGMFRECITQNNQVEVLASPVIAVSLDAT